MYQTRVLEDLDACQALWERLWPARCFFDLWPVRACFARAFDRPNRFLTVEEAGRPVGLAALSWIEETGSFGHFPGETWRGRTWLEQNRIIAANAEVLDILDSLLPGPAELRYLVHDSPAPGGAGPAVDEVGYLFHPGRCGYSFDAYMERFSGKSRKRLGREIEKLSENGFSLRHGDPADLDRMFALNLAAFRDYSYFQDRRFLRAFELLAAWLAERGMLRITTVLLGGKVAAIDVGAVWDRSYTVLAGGTDPDFPGVAKLINFQHIQWACAERIETVDFLCGDFGWKQRFHLDERPLYLLSRPGIPALRDSAVDEARVARAC